ncbi:MAG: hypothetical protein ACFCU9_09015 [Cyanophyceae cyanobacterium]|jgi:hypothetical protein
MIPATITADIVKARAKLAGITLDETYIDDLTKMMETAIAPLRTVDPETFKWVEPAVTFDAYKPD